MLNILVLLFPTSHSAPPLPLPFGLPPAAIMTPMSSKSVSSRLLMLFARSRLVVGEEGGEGEEEGEGG